MRLSCIVRKGLGLDDRPLLICLLIKHVWKNIYGGFGKYFKFVYPIKLSSIGCKDKFFEIEIDSNSDFVYNKINRREVPQQQ